ncbi:MAG: hypothetical protein E7345_00160 [Clostridiales bacterium]|nr:hypothetical protein [Clostridiales bacterium]
MVQVGVFSVTSNKINALIGCIDFLLSVIFAMRYAKYFNKTYQLKKNAKKEITKENKNNK